MKRWPGVVAAATVGLLVGAVVTLSLQGRVAATAPPQASRAADLPGLEAMGAASPSTFLAWVPGGLPEGFAAATREEAGLRRVTVVSEDDAWLVRSWSAAGELVDHPARPFRIPLDTAAVDPATFGSFLAPSDRADVAALSNGGGILGATSASLRGLGPGAVLDFGRGVRIRIVSVLPDELVGAAELLVSAETGRRIGVAQERYLLIQPRREAGTTARALQRRLRRLLPVEPGAPRRVQVRAPGETPYFRAGDGVLPPVVVKELFGEFAARPGPGGSIDVDPGWSLASLVTTQVPVLGTITCNRGIMPQLRGALQELRSRGLGSLIRTFHGCYVPRFIGRDRSNMLSYHSWGVAFDLNLAGNIHGAQPHQDPRLVRILGRWGFTWGGNWLVPDGSHFEYHRAAQPD